MAKTALIMKAQRAPKFSTRTYRRCKLCGRPRGYIRKFELCRLCFRKLCTWGMVNRGTVSYHISIFKAWYFVMFCYFYTSHFIFVCFELPDNFICLYSRCPDYSVCGYWLIMVIQDITFYFSDICFINYLDIMVHKPFSYIVIELFRKHGEDVLAAVEHLNIQIRTAFPKFTRKFHTA